MRIKEEDKESRDEQIRITKNEFETIKKEVSEIRKLGQYTKFADELMQSGVAKIKMYAATGSKEDLTKIKDLFDEIREEIKRIKNNDDNTYWKKEY